MFDMQDLQKSLQCLGAWMSVPQSQTLAEHAPENLRKGLPEPLDLGLLHLLVPNDLAFLILVYWDLGKVPSEFHSAKKVLA